MRCNSIPIYTCLHSIRYWNRYLDAAIGFSSGLSFLCVLASWVWSLEGKPTVFVLDHPDMLQKGVKHWGLIRYPWDSSKMAAIVFPSNRVCSFFFGHRLDTLLFHTHLETCFTFENHTWQYWFGSVWPVVTQDDAFVSNFDRSSHIWRCCSWGITTASC